MLDLEYVIEIVGKVTISIAIILTAIVFIIGFLGAPIATWVMTCIFGAAIIIFGAALAIIKLWEY